MMKKKNFYFSTRDLMVMAALAALGGVSSTYINLIGDFFQSLFGFAGTTQWAAGLHVIWITLSVLLVGKPGAATAAGILKGFVELFSGNSHGLLVVIIDITAGLIIDLFFLFSSQKNKPNLLLIISAGLASASNVIIFQVFASIPGDLLTMTAILTTSSVAFISGTVFSGLISSSIIASLRKIGLISVLEENPQRKKIVPYTIIAIGIMLTIISGVKYFSNLTQIEQITISGNVAKEMIFPDEFSHLKFAAIESDVDDTASKINGYEIKEILAAIEPISEEGILVVTAADGYSFFISFEEIRRNPDLILSKQIFGKKVVYNVVGAESPKACVQGVSKMVIVGVKGLPISRGTSDETVFFPQDHLFSMDSTYLDINGNSEKLQGIPLADVVNSERKIPIGASILVNSPTETIEIQYNSTFQTDGDIRIFLRFNEKDIEFILGEMNGTVLLRSVEGIEIKP